jgi:antagonist of KipI
MKFIKNGVLTTLQDQGRLGYRSAGINSNGSMDCYSFLVANILVRNPETEAVLEFFFPAPLLEFQEAVAFAITGADFSPKLNGLCIQNWKTYFSKKGDVLSFSKKEIGEIAYLAVQGGFASQAWLNSKSCNLILKHPQLSKELKVKENNDFNQNLKFGVSSRKWQLKIHVRAIRFVKGPHFKYLSYVSQQNILNMPFSVGQASNRMGYRLSGPKIETQEPLELISRAVACGTMQLLPNGQIVVLMADAQTTGGYPIVGFVSKVDIDLLAQFQVNTSFYFKEILIEKSFELIKNQAKSLQRIENSISLLY